MAGMWSLGGLSLRDLLKRTARESWQDNVFALAASLAFYHFLALFPVLLVLLIPLARLAQAGVGMRDLLIGSLPQLLPRDAATVIEGAMRDLDANAHRAGLVLAAAVAGAAWAGMNASWALIVGLNKAYETEENRSGRRIAVVAGGLGLAVVLMVFLALVATQSIGQALGGRSIPAALTAVAQWAAVTAILLISFTLFYRFGPNLKVKKWQWSTPGAVFGVMLWIASTLLLREYFNRLESYHPIYGRVAAVAVLMMWLYATSATVLIGAELNSEVEKALERTGQERAVRQTESGDAKPAGPAPTREIN